MRAAFNAHTRAGWRALGSQFDNYGFLDVGTPAYLALWQVDDYAVVVPDSRVSQWSTDPRSATIPLPNLSQGGIPECLFTVVNGEQRFTNLDFDGRVK